MLDAYGLRAPVDTGEVCRCPIEAILFQRCFQDVAFIWRVNPNRTQTSGAMRRNLVGDPPASLPGIRTPRPCASWRRNVAPASCTFEAAPLDVPSRPLSCECPILEGACLVPGCRQDPVTLAFGRSAPKVGGRNSNRGSEHGAEVGGGGESRCQCRLSDGNGLEHRLGALNATLEDVLMD